MRLSVITLSTPTMYNVKTASALLYHLLKNRPSDVIVTVYSYNINRIDPRAKKGIELELSCNITFLPIPYWIRVLSKPHLKFIRFLLKYPIYAYCSLKKEIIQRINVNNDAIWIYAEDLLRLVDKIQDKPIVITMPDSNAMFYYRMLSLEQNTRTTSSLLKQASNYIKYITLDRSYANCTFHFVGKEDARFFSDITGNHKAVFLNHPVYQYSVNDRIIKFHSPKIKILFTGRNNFYVQPAVDEAIKVFTENSSEINPIYSITLLGKDWENVATRLKQAGYDTNHIPFVQNFEQELSKHDIQLSPVTVGTGTKGRVLDALANGLLVIGTERALENIAVTHGESCLLYHNADELLNILRDIKSNRYRYQLIAGNGRASVLKNHNLAEISKQFFSLFSRDA